LLIKNEATPEAAVVGGSLTESPASGNADVTFTAHGIPDGPHVVEVDLEDAAGNKATVFSKTIQIQNHPTTPSTTTAVPVIAPPERGPCNGVPCSEAAKLTATAGEAKSLNRPQKKSALTLTGRLTTPTGAPIKDAQVKLLQQIQGASTTNQVATAATTADGSWSLKAPAGPSRLLRVAFYSHTLDVVPAATLDFHESVPAIVSIHAPRHVRLGQFFDFSGQLTGGYIPPGGEELQVRSTTAATGASYSSWTPTAAASGSTATPSPSNQARGGRSVRSRCAMAATRS
jgi:hypothetical protein